MKFCLRPKILEPNRIDEKWVVFMKAIKKIGAIECFLVHKQENGTGQTTFLGS